MIKNFSSKFLKKFSGAIIMAPEREGSPRAPEGALGLPLPKGKTPLRENFEEFLFFKKLLPPFPEKDYLLLFSIINIKLQALQKLLIFM